MKTLVSVPRQTLHPKLIIGTIPPAPIFKIYIQNIIGAIPNTNNNLRLPAPIVKTPSQKSYWYHF